VLDFVSSVPWDSFIKLPFVESIGLLKLLRLRRMSIVIRRSNVDVQLKVQFKLTFLTFKLIVMVHVIASIWFFFANNNQEIWVPNMYFINVNTLTNYIVFVPDPVQQYLISLYTGFYLFGVGEVCPRNRKEFIGATTILLIMAIYNAIIIGDIAIQQEELGRNQVMFQQKVDLTNTAMANLKLNPSLKNEVQAYISNTHNTLLKQNQLKSFLKEISPSFRIKCTSYIFQEIAITNSVFPSVMKDFCDKQRKMMPASVEDADIYEIALHKIVSKMEVALTMPEDVIIKQEDDPTVNLLQSQSQGSESAKEKQQEKTANDIQMYFIARGTCQVLQKRSHIVSVTKKEDEQE